ncbi:hypothetical protein HanRHA438_Chr01g0023301 [Helianthus annuus]|nr:hypothetical protein HanRHA438_Chr01g0023301 [Helianthus annuus]
MFFIKHKYKPPKSHTFQASILIIFITIKQPLEQIIRHNRNLTKLRRRFINFPNIKRRSTTSVANSGQH